MTVTYYCVWLCASCVRSAVVAHIPGRQYPVDVFYTPVAESDYIDGAVITLLQLHLEEAPGDVLVFLTGQEEIESLGKLLRHKEKLLPPQAMKLIVCELYSALSPEQQMAVFDPCPPGARKIILATNIAETSVTINGVRYVVDCGLVKTRSYNSRIGAVLCCCCTVSDAVQGLTP